MQAHPLNIFFIKDYKIYIDIDSALDSEKSKKISPRNPNKFTEKSILPKTGVPKMIDDR